MTEIKNKAEEYLEPIHRMYSCNNEYYTDEVIIQAYMDGYKQGYEDCRHYAHEYYKPKWHDLRKNPNDLPEAMGFGSREVYISYADGVTDIGLL